MNRLVGMTLIRDVYKQNEVFIYVHIHCQLLPRTGAMLVGGVVPAWVNQTLDVFNNVCCYQGGLIGYCAVRQVLSIILCRLAIC